MTGLFLARWLFLAALLLLAGGFGAMAFSDRSRR
jgi:hypothetical protein